MSDSTKLIPVYTPDQAKTWLEGISTSIRTAGDILLILLTFLGFLVFSMGILRYMRAARDGSSGQGGAEGYRESIWMIVAGALFAVIGGIFIFFVGIGRSSFT